MSDFAEDVRAVAADVVSMLIEKNEAYGNSALDPVRVFSRAPVVEQLARGNAAGEDVERDLLGYLIILRVARLRDARAKERA